MDEFANTVHSTEAILRHRIVISDMRRAWGELDEVELAAIKNRADLVMQVQANYGLDKNQAQTSVDRWTDGREF
jgi:hypothetical protein